MGWAVGYDDDHDRWRGYGVPAHCDATGCQVEIDRGLGWVCSAHLGDEDFDDLEHPIFVCAEHSCADVDEAAIWQVEHPHWVAHILADTSWQQWRDENAARVAQFQATTTAQEPQ